MERLAAPLDSQPMGLYALDQTFNFNTLDAVTYNVRAGTLSLIGHFDPRFIGPRIPYLQHLAALLDIKDEPHFSLETTAASLQAVKSRVASSGYSRQELLKHFDEVFEPGGEVSWLGRSILRSLGLSPVKNHRPPGYLGAIVEARGTQGLQVTGVIVKSPADEAGLRAGDVIVQFDGKTPATPTELGRLARFAGSRSSVTIGYRRNGRPEQTTAKLTPDPDADPWLELKREDVDALLPSSTAGQSTVERLRAYAESLPDGFQVAPELLQRVADLRAESVPEFFGEPPTTQLARLMFEADYSVIKNVGHRVDLKERLPGYLTLFDYKRRHPAIGDAIGGQRIWASVAAISLKQSPSGETLAIGDTKMRFNMRSLRSDGRDAPTTRPEIAAYAEMLTRYYDDLAEDYFALHELREAAKLAAAANWIRQKTPSFRLPAEGRVSWKAPAKVPGMTFAQMAQARGEDLAMVVHGGVNLNPCLENTRICVVPFDRGVRDPGKAELEKALPNTGIPAAGGSTVVDFDGAKRQRAQIDINRIRDKTEILKDAVGDAPRLASKSAIDQEEKKRDAEIAKMPVATAKERYRRAERMLELAELEHARGDNDKAVKLVQDAQKISPNHPRLFLLRAASDEQEGHRPEAIAELREYLRKVKDNPDAEGWLKRLERADSEGRVRPVWNPPKLQPTPGFGSLAPPQQPPQQQQPGRPLENRPPQSGPPSPVTPLPGGMRPPDVRQPGPPTVTEGPPNPGQPNATSSPIAPPSPGQPRSVAGTRQIATTTDMADSDSRLRQAKERFGALEREVDPCNFDASGQGRFDPKCMTTVSVKAPVGRPVEPPAETWKERKDELERARNGWKHRREELQAKPQESWTPEEKKEFDDIPKIETRLDQEEKKAEKQIEAGDQSKPPELPQTFTLDESPQ